MPRIRPLGTANQRRKRENAEAKRNYRARQKERVKALEQMVVSALASKDVTTCEAKGLSQAHGVPATQQALISGSLGPMSSATESSSSLFQLLLSLSKDETQRCAKIMAREDFGLRDLVKYGLICLGYGVDASLFNSALLLPSKHWIDIVESNYTGIDIMQVVSCGVRTLAQLTQPLDWPSLDFYRQSHSGPSAGGITLVALSCVSAQFLNVMHLSGSLQDMLDDDAQSRFYAPRTGGESESVPDGHIGYRHIAPDLRPTIAQRTLPHHPFVDIIPWPSMRTNILLAASTDPSAIDEDDLCLDLLNGGLRCWGSRLGSLHGRGEGVPWDARSWEAMPWFLEKWKFITGGEDGEVSRNSAWWRAMQGIDV